MIPTDLHHLTMLGGRFAVEVELTAASYGTPDPFGRVLDPRFVRNIRLLLAAYYFF
ncbi:MAG: hypothetical protein ACXWHJ_11585 [Candidatus Aminicenantales bacterium]